MGNITRRGIDAYKQTINQKTEETDGFIKTTQPAQVNKPKTFEKPKANKTEISPHTLPNPKIRKVAKFLILVGGEYAAQILSQLDINQVEEISKEIATIKVIQPEEGKEILAEFENLFSMPYRYSGLSFGGIETARRILYAAMGPEKGEAMLNKSIPDSKENIFGFLEEFTPEQLVLLLKAETPQTASLILSRLPPAITAATISKLPQKNKAEILKRIAHQNKISPEILNQVSSALKDKVRHLSGGAKDIEIDGMSKLAAILKHGEVSFGDRIINELEDSDPDIGKDLKDNYYTLDDVVNSIERPLQEKLKSMSDTEIALLLKGRGNAFTEKLLSCVSAGRRKLIREEFEILGAVPKRDCDTAAKEFLAWFRLAREDGDIILTSDEDVYL